MTDFLAHLRRLGKHAAGVATLPGCDVSAFQGEPRTWRAEAGRISWAAAKLTEVSPAGTYVNPDAADDFAYLKQQGKGRIGYLFGHPATSPAATADAFLAACKRVGLDDGDGVAIDLETSDGRTPGQVAVWATDVAVRLDEALDRRPLIYTFLSFAEGGYCQGLGGFPLWIADINSPAGHPRVPPPWTTYAIHQYSWNPIDRDVARFLTVAAMRAALGRRQPKPKPLAEDPMLLLNGPGADTPVALPDGAKSVRLVSTGQTAVNVQFAGHDVQSVSLSWGHGVKLDVPAGSHSVRVYRGPEDHPDVPVSVAVS